jgi:dihydropteroate synthase
MLKGPPEWAGLLLDRVRIMGVVNVTPDSFSDGGAFADPATAIAHARGLLAEGADILDIGGESTRPGALAVPAEEQIRRVVPVIAAVARDGAVISVDTRFAEVMTAAVAAGARIVNDVSALEDDPAALAAVARSAAAIVLMHKKGDPATMQRDVRYTDVVADVRDYLAARIAACETAGIARSRIAIDPGIGFGKDVAGNLRLIRELDAFQDLGCAVAIGVSRKSFIGHIAGAAEPKQRLPGSLAAALAAVARGARIVRVHDVAATRQAMALWEKINQLPL